MTQTILYIATFIVGMAAIIKGADWLTDGGAAVARRYGISTLVIGLTIVAFGSSMPEFIVSFMSAIEHNTDMAIGNVVGSNIFNIYAIVGCTALTLPIVCTRNNIRYDIPFMMLSSIVVAVAALDGFFTPGEADVISRTDGLLMLCIFAIFMFYTFSIARDGGQDKRHDEDVEQKPVMPMWKAAAWIVIGLAALILGGRWLVSGASGMARMMNISESIIALTIVSIGTSAPELAASVMAARKGDSAMALGNVIGSVIFNVFFVLGTSATIYPLTIGNITSIDMQVLLLAAALIWVFAKFGKKRYVISRWEGVVLIAIQVLYYIYLIMQEL